MAEPEPWNQLLAALDGHRPFEPRMSGLPFVDFSRPRSGLGPEDVDRSPELWLAALRVRQEKDRASSPEEIIKIAISHLALGEPNAAVELLEAAAESTPEHPELQANLAGAYSERAKQTRTHLDFVRALDSARRATWAAPNNPEAWFNLALALEGVHLYDEAREAWLEAAGLESGDWAAEAAHRAAVLTPEPGRLRRREMLTAQLRGAESVAAGAAQPDFTAEIVERDLLLRWSWAQIAGDDEEANRASQLALALADMLDESTGDAGPARLASALISCGLPCAEGWRHHLRAQEAWERDDFLTARAETDLATAALGADLTPVNAFRSLRRAALERVEGDTESAIARLARVTPYLIEHRYLALAGRAYWQTGLLANEGADLGMAMRHYRTASDLLTKAGDREGQAMVHSLMAFVYQQLDDLEQAWEHELAALSAMPLTWPSRQMSILLTAADLAASSMLHAAALTFRSPLVKRSRAASAQHRLALLVASDATDLQALGRLDEARVRLGEADRSLGALEDDDATALARAWVRIAQGRFQALRDPIGAATTLQESIDIYRSRGSEFATASLQLERGRALAAGGRSAAAETALLAGLDVAERERRSVLAEEGRISALSARWDLYTALADQQLQARGESAAYAVIASARALNLRERVGQVRPPETDRLPSGVAALEYAVLPSGVHGWLTTASLRQHFRVGLAPDGLSALVDGYRDALVNRESPDRLKRLSTQLHEALIGPVAQTVRQSERLIVVPDGSLHELPFASLLDPSTGRYLVEDASVLTSPSLAFSFAAVVSAHLVEQPLPAMIIGNPDRNGAFDDRLPPLPAAEAEALAISGLYPEALASIGAAITKASFLQQASNVSMIHFAGHAVVNSREPDLSRLLLTPTEDDPLGALLAADLLQRDLSQVRLVVLSACDTGRGAVTRGEGVVGFVRSFLAAGVSSVLATLWAVDDDSAATLVTAFHRAWAAGLSSADALRAAQMEVLAMDGSHVSDWASAVVVGTSVHK